MTSQALVLFLSVILAVPATFAQSPETFEVVSVKLGDPLNPGTSFRLEPGGGIKIEGASLKSLILYAYDLREFQLVGARGWMTSDRFTILAKGMIADGPADYRQMNDQQRKAMVALVQKRLRAMLAERFQLAVHRETKELPIYALVVAKKGVKMQPSTSPDGTPQSMTTGRAMFRATRASMDGIRDALAGLTGRPVRDETGLTGYYDFKMEWTPDPVQTGAGAAEEKPPDTLGPSLFTALQEQLGLKLEAKKGPVEIVVIDRVGHPSEN